MSCQILIIDVLTVFLEDDNSNLVLQLCSKLILLILQLDSIHILHSDIFSNELLSQNMNYILTSIVSESVNIKEEKF